MAVPRTTPVDPARPSGLPLIAVIVWFVVVFFAALSPPHGGLRGTNKLPVIGASVLAAVIAGVQPVLVRSLFRR